MTLRSWLRSRSPEPPPRLIERLVVALGARADLDAGQAVPICLDAASELLDELLARPSAGRESALDLLTVDALVTYAFEAAAADADTIGSRANEAMARFAALARPRPSILHPT